MPTPAIPGDGLDMSDLGDHALNLSDGRKHPRTDLKRHDATNDRFGAASGKLAGKAGSRSPSRISRIHATRRARRTGAGTLPVDSGARQDFSARGHRCLEGVQVVSDAPRLPGTSGGLISHIRERRHVVH